MNIKERVLVVDDEDGIVSEIQEYLTDEGYDVQTAFTAKMAYKSLSVSMPPILIVDIRLPDASGLEVARIARALSPELKIIIITGFVDESILNLADACKADAFLYKPFDLNVLQSALQESLPCYAHE